MSRQYNPAVAAYKRMNLDEFAALQKDKTEVKSDSGLLARTKNSNNDSSGIDYSNPVARVAKQMLVVRKYRDEINGIK